ncbi:MAG: MFS transporter [Brevibacterium sp.]|uniref:MFS transporter n=1 Tax=Brevibacterium sp. TaxID=1701 RepID=UPI0026488597|nr:MFS transporter [Brevibacterium sp.]MDN5806430.1 MFS transporter [Brevibacterium sp.]MDN5834303.1 MFS transporter [Brevibacterium sp.]MDN5876920.1 MFS transporter [Brevibacterium sp.]MDN5908603.1 MFS transporter [Brevibacterium sp.]MDN6133235.1 MFS transporter [Brevibacterium sp.]
MVTADTARPRRSPLWGHRDFMKLWAGDTVSVFGSELVFFALPLIAVSLLDADAFQMGLLATLESAAFLLISLPAGAWIDRLPKKIVIVSGDIVRAGILLTIPLAWSFGALSMLQLYLVAAGVGIVTVFFDIANQSYLPELVAGGSIGDGNGKLQASQQTAGVVGPTLASGLVTAIGAPLTVGLTSACMGLSSLFVSRIRHRETPPEPATRTGFIAEIREGLGFVLGHRLLRRITACTGLTNFAASGIFALLVLFVLTTLGLSQVQLGIIMSASAIGGILGALSAAWVQSRLGEGTSISVSAMFGGLSFFGMPLATVLPAFPTMLVASLVTGWAVVVYNIAQVSFRQRLCPKPLLGRMNASIRFLVWGPMPLGSLLAGFLGDSLGVSTTMWILAACSLAASILVLVSPLLRMRTLPRELDLLSAASDAEEESA